MNGKQLKNSILQWVIQGKLVPQDPNDEPASVLLDKIRQEKERLIKEKKIKRDKNASIIYRGEDNSYYEKILATGEVKCIDEEIPFEIPQGWEWCRMRDVIYPPKYGTSSKSLSNGDVPVLRMGNIQDGKVVYDKLVFSNNVEDNRKYLLQDGDLLFNRTNSAELVGKTAIFKGNRHVIYAGYLILLRPIKTNSEYLNYVFSSPYVRSYCKEVKTIGVQQCNINAEKVSQLLVPIAPFEEQMRIVDKIKEVQSCVDKYSISQYSLDLLNVSLSERLKKSFLQEAIQGKLVPQIAEEGTAKELLEQIKKEKQKLVKEGKLKKSALSDSVIFRGDDNKYWEKSTECMECIDDKIPFEIPSTWCWVRHNQLFEISGGSQPPKSQFVDSPKSGYIRLYQIRDYGLNPMPVYIPKEKANKITKEGDIILARYGGSLGKVFWAKDGAYNVAMAKVIPLFDSEFVNKQYLFLFYQSSIYQYLVKDHSRSAQAGFNKDDLTDLFFPLPPLEEQSRIVEKYKSVTSTMSR